MTIRTNYDFPPIPTRSHDWSAWIDGNEERGPIGRGATEAEAIADLKEQIGEKATCLWCEQGNKPVHQLQDGRWIQPCTARSALTPNVWDHTLDEYEKSILNGDAQGAAILRALLLEGLKAKQSRTIDCAFCGKNLTECECPQPL